MYQRVDVGLYKEDLKNTTEARIGMVKRKTIANNCRL